MIPKIDSQIGINVYSTKFKGIGGKIRIEPEDFIVSEKISEKILKTITEKGGYAVFKLKKRKIDTNHALSDVSKKRGIRLKALGLKDAHAVTEQYVCSINQMQLPNEFSAEKYSLHKIGYIKKPLTKKDMIGNHFIIKITDCNNRLSEFHDYDKILNFYGYQRFGSNRPVTHLIGKAILQKKFKEAVELIVSFTSPYDSKENIEIREKLRDKTNYKKYLSQVPPQMDVERIVIQETINHEDYQKTLRAIPLSLRRFYIQAYQSYIFNRSLCSAFSYGEDLFNSQSGDVGFDDKGILGKFVIGLNQKLAFPIVGFSHYKKTRFERYISDILREEEVFAKDFFIKEMQEVSNEGGFRQASIDCTCHSSHNNVVEFSLSRGSFATILLREIMKPEDPINAGF